MTMPKAKTNRKANTVRQKPSVPHTPASSRFDIEEFCAIEEFKRGQRERLALWQEKQQGKPHSPMLDAFLPDVIRGKKFRTRGGQANPSQVVKITDAIIMAGVRATVNAKLLGIPSSRKAILLDAAKLTGLSLKSIEKVAYRKTSGLPSQSPAS